VSNPEPAQPEASNPDPVPLSPWRRMPLNRLVTISGAAVLAVAALFGGLQEADHVTPVAFGDTYSDGPLRITPRLATVVDAIDGFKPLSAECRYLVVRAEVSNSAPVAVPIGMGWQAAESAEDCSDRTSSTIVDVPLVLRGLTTTFAGARRVRGPAPAETFDPGFADVFDLVWMVPVAELREDRKVELLMPQMTHIVSTLQLNETWVADPDQYGALPVPVGAAR